MDIKFEWKETHHNAFMKLKEAIIQAPILQYPDMTKPYIVYTDASQRCLQSSVLTDTRWNQIPSSFLVTYIYSHPEEIEYTRTRSLRYLLHCQEMEVLPTKSRHHSKKRPQTFSTVLKWKEQKHKDQQMGTRTRLR